MPVGAFAERGRLLEFTCAETKSDNRWRLSPDGLTKALDGCHAFAADSNKNVVLGHIGPRKHATPCSRVVLLVAPKNSLCGLLASRRPAPLGRRGINEAMNFQIDVTSTPSTPVPSLPAVATTAAAETVELLKQILEVQREQLSQQKAAAAAHDLAARWRGFLSRWQEEFPDLSDACRKALPALERSYGQLIKDLTDRLTEDDEPLDSDFALQEFLDRYGMRLAQLGTILNLVAPLAEAGPQGETT